MKIAVSGLGKMGMQIAERLSKEGHQVIANNRSSEKVDFAATFGATKAYSKEEVLTQFEGQQAIVWIMIPADAVQSELMEWIKLLKAGDIVVDGGNSDFRKTKEHYKIAQQKGVKFLDVGTSGGILGLENGFSMMVGGDLEAFKSIEPALESLSKPSGGYHYFGESGTGNFVKMVHNAIEYGMMESLAEGYRMLKEGPYKSIDLAAAADVWEKGSIVKSSLNSLTAEALHENPELEGIEGYVAENGEARWTLEVAQSENLPMPAIKAAFDVRIASQNGQTNFATKLLAAMRNKFGGHKINK